MFENLKDKLKKASAVSLAAVVLCTAGCGQTKEYDFTAADLSSYVEIPDIGKYSYETILGEYEKEREEAKKETGKSFVLRSGYSMDFYVTAYVKNGNEFERYEEYCRETLEEPVKNYYVLQNEENREFDRCLMANVASSEDDAVSTRLIYVGKAFSFTMNIAEDCENADIAGKTMRFVITPVSYAPPLFNDGKIIDDCREYFTEDSNKDTVERGDAVFLSVSAVSLGKTLYSDDDVFLFVGDNTLFPGFDEWLEGQKLGSASFSVNFDSEAFTVDSVLYAANGKTVDFNVNIVKICETDGKFDEFEHFDDVWSMKEYLRLRIFAVDYLYNDIMESSKVTSYPKGGYKMIEEEIDQMLDSYIEYYTDYLEERLENVSEEYIIQYMQKDVFGMEEYEPFDTFREGLIETTLDYIIINNALADMFEVEYSYEDYEADLKQALSDDGEYEMDISEMEQSTIGGRQYLYAYFIAARAAEALADTVM